MIRTEWTATYSESLYQTYEVGTGMKLNPEKQKNN
jgi:hypothetical protein